MLETVAEANCRVKLKATEVADAGADVEDPKTVADAKSTSWKQTMQ